MKINKIFLLGVLLAAGACSSDNAGSEPEPKAAAEVGLSLTKGTPPAVNTTYGFMAYPSGAATEPASTGIYRYAPAERDNLLPCTVDADANITAPYTPGKGLILSGGKYRTFMYTPAFPVENTGFGSIRIKYRRNNPVFVNLESFPLTIDYYQKYVIPADDITLTEMISKFYFDFTRKFEEFTVSNLKLHNVGEQAYYHPLLHINEVIDADQYSQTITVVPTGDTGVGEVVYEMSGDVDVFPTDYTSGASLELMLTFDLTINGVSTEMSIPIALNIEASRLYRFHINVTSTLIDVTYTITPWVDHNSIPGENIGDPGLVLPLGTFTVDGWNSGGNGNEVIG